MKPSTSVKILTSYEHQFTTLESVIEKKIFAFIKHHASTRI